MSNNAPDYEDNLVFPPQEIKSQDDIKHQEGRDTDVLIKALEKCEKLEIQLGIVIEILLRECPQYEGYVRANFPNYKRS
jgi:hypothetical protein